MFEFVRLSCCVPAINVADVSGNTEKIITQLRCAAEDESNLAVFPELCLTGYTCQDLFFQQALLEDCEAALEQLRTTTDDLSITAVVGTPLRIQGQLYNCAVVLSCGEISGIVPKTFLPNYGEYYEKRWFSSSEDLRVSETLLCGRTVPVGRDLIFTVPEGTRFGIELCEDLWTPLPPSTFLAMGGAEILLNPSASNETIAKRDYRRQLVLQQSARCLAAYVYCSAGWTESTQDLVYSGDSLIAENGILLEETPGALQTDYVLSQDLDLGRLRADRRKCSTFSDAARIYSTPMREIPCPAREWGSNGILYPISDLPFVPANRRDRLSRCMDIFEMQVAGLKKRLSVTGGKAVIGVSGGLDSTLALLVSAEAMRQLSRPLTDVIGVTMPCFGTTDQTYRNALTLMQTLGISSAEIPIHAAVEQHFSDIGHDKEKIDLTYENSQARERTQVLMDYAGEVGGLVIGTGDLSELALGWCTYNADHMSMYNVNVSIPKTLIRWIINTLAEYHIFSESSDVLQDILATPISPELIPPDKNGKIVQQTESIVGPYALHDFFLYYTLRFGFSPEKIFYLAKLAFSGEDPEVIKKWLKTFYRRFVSQQFKRSCLPDGIKIGSVCLSPRGDWRMPSDASAAIWLRRAEAL